MNSVALFVTHSIFLTEDEASKVADGQTISTTGHCVPVWVDAKTGKTTEPAKEVFCHYVLHNSGSLEREVKIIPKKGYEIYLPKSSAWGPPPQVDYEKISTWPSEERIALFKEMERWWFSNPKPHDAENLRRGYLRFETKRVEAGKKKNHNEQHVIEIAFWQKLVDSLAT
jgi:hypothetical protein